MRMIPATILSISALAALVPAAVFSARPGAARTPLWWLLLAVAFVGTACWLAATLSGEWHTGLSFTLYLIIAVSLALFAALAAMRPNSWRLGILLYPYLILLGALALGWQGQSGQPMTDTVSAPWVVTHIILAVVAYGLINLAAIAGLAVVLQERALKRKRPTRLTDSLPSVADAELLQVRLLGLSAIVLAFGVLSGMATEYYVSGRLLDPNHKTLLTLLAFAVLSGLLLVHSRTGMRGRRAARLLLIAWMLLTLAYPGVKFVTDVILT